MKLDQSFDLAIDQFNQVEEPSFEGISFDWEGIPFKASTNEQAGGRTEIRLHADLGRLYFTAENADQRTMAIEQISTANRSIDGAYSYTKRGEVFFENLTTANGNLSGNELMSAITVILLESGNHLRLLRSLLKTH